MGLLTTKIPKAKAKRVISHAIILAASIVITIILLDNKVIHHFLEYVSGVNFFLAALLSGALFTSIFTTPIAIASLIILGQEHSPLAVSLIAACGSVIGDAILLKFIRQDVLSDVEVFTKPFTSKKLRHTFKSKLLFFPLTLMAAIILASPLPDELAIALFGAIKFKTKYFYVLSFIFNFLGILIITKAGSLF